MRRRGEALDVGAGDQTPEQPLPPERDDWGRHRCPRRVQLAGDRAEEDGVVPLPAVGERRDLDRIGHLETSLAPTARPLDVLEYRAASETGKADLDTGRAQQRDFAGTRGVRIGTDERPHAQAESHERERPVCHGAAEPPATRIVGGDVARGGAHDEHRGPRAGAGLGASVGARCGA